MVKSPFAAVPARSFPMIEPAEPVLYRDQFPFTEIPRILFDGVYVHPQPPSEIWITDTTFRDGQQARPPYTPSRSSTSTRSCTSSAARNGVIRQSEFFLYSEQRPRARSSAAGARLRVPGDHRLDPRRCQSDFRLVKEIGLKETGILTSVLRLPHLPQAEVKTRRQAMDDYLGDRQGGPRRGHPAALPPRGRHPRRHRRLRACPSPQQLMRLAAGERRAGQDPRCATRWASASPTRRRSCRAASPS